LPISLASDAEEKKFVITRPNPFKWDPLAAAGGRCIICTNGVPGCPRCFMMPFRPDGTKTTLSEFAFNPAVENEKTVELQRIQLKIMAKKSRKLRNIKYSTTAGEFEDGSLGSLETFMKEPNKYYDNDGNDIAKNKFDIHTNLTNFQSVNDYRNIAQKLITVFIKVMPSGYVKKVIVEAKDTIFHVYNNFCSNSKFGTTISPMIILPTDCGFFELHNEMEEESDLLLANKRGMETLENYGFTDKNNSIVLIFSANYKKKYLSILLSKYCFTNLNFVLSEHLPIYEELCKIPKSLFNDNVQQQLLAIIADEYHQQQRHSIDVLNEMIKNFHGSREAQIEKAVKLEKSTRDRIEQEQLTTNLRTETQLKSLPAEKRKQALKELKIRELKKKRWLVKIKN
jgi:hypothetical protein